MNQKPIMEDDELEIDLVDLFFYYWAKKWILLAALLIGAACAGLFTHYAIAPTYASTSKLYVFNSSGAIDFSSLQLSTNLTNDYMEMIKSRPVVETVAENLKTDYDYEELLDMLSVNNPDSTRFLEITITDTDPKEACELANEFAEVTRQQIAAVMKQDMPSIVEKAVVPEQKVGPSLKKNTALGGLGLLVLIMVIYAVIYLMDDTIKTEEDIRRFLDSTTLAIVPLGEGEVSGRKGLFGRKKGGKA